MTRFLFLLACSLSSMRLAAQIGVTGAFATMKAGDWYEPLMENEASKFENIGGYTLGVDYWFRLKNKRIEFVPEVNYGIFKKSLVAGDLSHRLLNLQFNTNFYLLDLNNDCNCPTFSKQGDFFAKGFFVQLSPGITHFVNSLETEGDNYEDTATTLAYSGGVGVDVGVSDFITVTPLARLQWHYSVKWEGLLLKGYEGQTFESNVRTLWLGINVRFNFKKEKRF